jgi:hypothetical protein
LYCPEIVAKGPCLKRSCEWLFFHRHDARRGGPALGRADGLVRNWRYLPSAHCSRCQPTKSFNSPATNDMMSSCISYIDRFAPHELFIVPITTALSTCDVLLVSRESHPTNPQGRSSRCCSRPLSTRVCMREELSSPTLIQSFPHNAASPILQITKKHTRAVAIPMTEMITMTDIAFRGATQRSIACRRRVPHVTKIDTW